MPAPILNFIVYIFLGICIVNALVQIVAFLLVRYSKNYRLTVLYFTCMLFFNPWYASAYGNRGFARLNLKELEQAIALDPNSEDAYFWAGMVYASQGYDEEALVALQQAQELDVPKVLMTPLYLLEKTRPVFFEKCVSQFLSA